MNPRIKSIYIYVLQAKLTIHDLAYSKWSTAGGGRKLSDWIRKYVI
jgi:hypothetical protein